MMVTLDAASSSGRTLTFASVRTRPAPMVPKPAIKKGTDTCMIVWYHFSFLMSFPSPWAFGSLRCSGSGSKTAFDEIVTIELPLERDPCPFTSPGVSFLSILSPPGVFKPAVDASVYVKASKIPRNGHSEIFKRSSQCVS